MWFAERLLMAHLELEKRLGRRVTQPEVAKGIADRLGGTLTGSAINIWFKGRVVPPVGTIAAAAEFYGVNAGWLAFNEGAPGWAAEDVAEREAISAARAAIHAAKEAYRDLTPRPAKVAGDRLVPRGSQTPKRKRRRA